MGKQTNLIDDILAGAFAGCVARMLTAPFDVIKIRFQLQNNADKKYTSVLQSLRSIVTEEGFFSLWKGNVSALYLWVSYSMIQFATYDVLKNLGETILDPFEQRRGDTDAKKTPIQSSSSKSQWSAFKRSLVLFVAGAGAGMIATATTYPFDITRTQFALQGKEIMHGNVQSFLKHTVSKHGIRGLFVGLPAAVVGIMPYMGLNFAIYDAAKRLLPSDTHQTKTKTTMIFLNGACGALAGGLSKFVVFPLDTIKKRMQARVLQNSFDGSSVLPKFESIRQCILFTIRTEGVKGFYRGIVPTSLKSVVGTAVAFAAYEGGKDIISLTRKNLGNI